MDRARPRRTGDCHFSADKLHNRWGLSWDVTFSVKLCKEMSMWCPFNLCRRVLLASAASHLCIARNFHRGFTASQHSQLANVKDSYWTLTFLGRPKKEQVGGEVSEKTSHATLLWDF